MKVNSRFAVLLLLCSLAVWSSGCATKIFLHPETAQRAAIERPVNPATYGDHPEFVSVTNRFGYRLRGWMFSSPTNHGVVLIGDGNATAISHTYSYNRFLLNQGFNVLILSYQGYDANEGPANIKSLEGDVETFYAYCRARFPGQPVALLAESLSTAPFFCCASRHREIAALTLEATVNPKTVVLATANNWWFLYPLYPLTLAVTFGIRADVPQDLDLGRALKRHPVIPALFIHHPKDRITPYRSARKIFERYEGPKEWITLNTERSRAYHMDGYSNPEVQQRLLHFLKKNLAAAN